MTKMVESFTVVAFKYDQHHSVLYQSTHKIETVADLVLQALKDLNADVISIRRVTISEKRNSY